LGIQQISFLQSIFFKKQLGSEQSQYHLIVRIPSGLSDLYKFQLISGSFFNNLLKPIFLLRKFVKEVDEINSLTHCCS